MKKLNLKPQTKNKAREAYFLIRRNEKYLSDGHKWGRKQNALKFNKIIHALEVVKTTGGQIEKLIIK